MVNAQQARDKKISALVKTMDETYSFTRHADKFRDGCALQPVVEQILKQTIECGFFIMDYGRDNFGGK